MTEFDLNEHPHRRFNPLTGSYVLVSPHRAKRPWQGQVEKKTAAQLPEYDSKCYLCPGNTRAGGARNPDYTDVFVFDNDFGALTLDNPPGDYAPTEFIQASSEKGVCRVICFSPRHDLTLPEMEEAQFQRVIAMWQEQFEQLGSFPEINHVQIFENKGQVMGCSNPHPHGQIWAQETLPMIPAAKTHYQETYFAKHQRSLLIDYLKFELDQKVRVITEGEHFVSLVPFWAVWPYETMIIPKRQVRNITELHDEEKKDFAHVAKDLLIRYDNLFETSFPYSGGLHQMPTDGNLYKGWHFHMLFLPPLLRSATVKKFMVGYEMMGEPQRDITAEMASQTLRSLSNKHYKK